MTRTFTELHELLVRHFGETIVAAQSAQGPQPSLTVPAGRIADACRFLYENEAAYFDRLECLTAVDNGPQTGTLEVLYHLHSIPYGHSLVLKVEVPRGDMPEHPPQVPTVSHIWRTADWHEREAFDFFGILFTGHPDLRRILLPADWQGHPLRKDYTEQDTYHGITVRY